MRSHRVRHIAQLVIVIISLLVVPARAYAQYDETTDIRRAVEQALVSRPLDLYLGTPTVNPSISRSGDWALAAIVLHPDRVGEDEPSGGLFAIAHRQPSGWNAALQGSEQFLRWLPSVPTALLSDAAKRFLGEPRPQGSSTSDLVPLGNAAARLSLPYPTGESWLFSGGPHGGSRSALDFARNGGQVRATSDGTAMIPCANQIIITHGDGWQTGYYHVSNIRVANGATVRRGDVLGTASTAVGCGGRATGDHVHFWLRRNGVDTPIHDTVIGGWTVQQGAAEYDGCLLKQGRTACQGSWIYNDGMIGDGGENDPQPINSGQQVTGRIDPANDDDTYTFSAVAGQVITAVMERTDSSNLDSYIELYGPSGLIGYDDDGAGNFNSRLVKSLPQSGPYRIIVHSWNHQSTGAYRLNVSISTAGDGDDGRWIGFDGSLQGAIDPASDRDVYYFNAVAGRTISLRMNKLTPGLDSFLEIYGPGGAKIAENDDGGTDRNAWVVANLTEAGTYRVVARSWNGESAGSYTLVLAPIDGGNLARGKPAYASSIEGNLRWLAPGNATDANTTTRWASAYSDAQWIYVDLGRDYSVNQVVLRWEQAFGDKYDIYVQASSECGTCWRHVYGTDRGDGNVDTITFNPTTARYVLMAGRHRYAHYGWLQWGYSLWEFEVYNTLAALIPTVPPEQSNKPAETIVPLIPLPPDPQDKAAPTLGQGTGQENMPSASTTSSDAPPDVKIGEIYGPPSALVSLSDNHVIAGRDSITLAARDAHDTDEQGNSIVAYRWTSSLDGLLGNAAVVTLEASQLSIGIHTITLEVQDNEGNWSIPAQANLTVQQQAAVYIPFAVR